MCINVWLMMRTVRSKRSQAWGIYQNKTHLDAMQQCSRKNVGAPNVGWKQESKILVGFVWELEAWNRWGIRLKEYLRNICRTCTHVANKEGYLGALTEALNNSVPREDKYDASC